MRSCRSSSNNRDLLDRVNTPGELLSLIRAGTAVTRADLARHTGLARSTVAQRVDALLASGLLLEAGGTPSTGGRPATMLAFNHQAGVVLVADLGATHARVAVTDLAGTTLAERAGDLDIALGPAEVLKWVSARFDELLDQTGTRPGRRPRDRDRRAGPGGVRHRAAGQPADHARLGRLRHPRLVRGPLRRAGARGQRREHHGPGGALGSLAPYLPPPVREGRHGHRLRDRRRRSHPPGCARSGRGHRPHPSHRRGRDLRMRQHRLPGGGRRRSRPCDAARGVRGRGIRTAATSSGWSTRATSRRPRWCAQPAARSARSSPAR